MSKIWKIRIIIIFALAAVIYVGYGMWNDNLERQEVLEGAEWEVPLSENFGKWENKIRNIEAELNEVDLELVFAENPYYSIENSEYTKKLLGVKKKDGTVIIPPIYDWLSVDVDKKYIYAEKPYYEEEMDYESKVTTDFLGLEEKQEQYYKLDGSELIKGEFDEINESDGYYICAKKNEKAMVLNIAGEKLLELQEGDIWMFDSDKGIFLFSKPISQSKNEFDNVPNGGSTWGLIDAKGNILLEPIYDGIEKASDSRILVRNRGNYKHPYNSYMYLNEDFQPITSAKYQEASYFDGGYAVVKDEAGWHIINEAEKIIADIPQCKTAYGFSEGIAVAEFKRQLKYIDTQGNVLFAGPYMEKQGSMTFISYFSEGKIQFMDRNKKIGYLNKKGEVVVKAIFDRAEDFKNGTAFVQIGRKGGIIRVNDKINEN